MVDKLYTQSVARECLENYSKHDIGNGPSKVPSEKILSLIVTANLTFDETMETKKRLGLIPKKKKLT
jgi:hypothetical protein